MRIRLLMIAPILLLGATLTTLHAQPTLDLEMVERIKKEGMDNSQIME